MALTTHTGAARFDFAAALVEVNPQIAADIGPTLRDVAPQEFQAIALAILSADYVTVRRLRHCWGGLFEATGATPLIRHARQLQQFADIEDAAIVANALGSMREDLTRFCKTLTQLSDRAPSTGALHSA